MLADQYYHHRDAPWGLVIVCKLYYNNEDLVASALVITSPES